MSEQALTERASRIDALGYDYAQREKEVVRACNLCGSTAHAEASRRDRYGYPAVLRICTTCGLGFLSPRLTPGEYGAFYEGVYRPLVSAYHGRTIDAQTVQAEQREYAAELMEFLRPELPQPPTAVMDIGGSTGIVAQAAREAFGAEATVLDPASDELQVAADLGMETVAGFAEDFDPAGRSWDLVLLCQTIDHLLDIDGTIRAIRRMLSPSGRAFVDVVDYRFIARRKGGIEQAVKIDHAYYLTREPAVAYFERAGLEVVAERMSDDGHWGFLLAGTEPREPDWAALRTATDGLLAELWRLRADAG